MCEITGQLLEGSNGCSAQLSSRSIPLLPWCHQTRTFAAWYRCVWDVLLKRYSNAVLPAHAAMRARGSSSGTAVATVLDSHALTATSLECAKVCEGVVGLGKTAKASSHGPQQKCDAGVRMRWREQASRVHSVEETRPCSTSTLVGWFPGCKRCSRPQLVLRFGSSIHC